MAATMNRRGLLQIHVDKHSPILSYHTYTNDKTNLKLFPVSLTGLSSQRR